MKPKHEKLLISLLLLALKGAIYATAMFHFVMNKNQNNPISYFLFHFFGFSIITYLITFSRTKIHNLK